MTIGTGADEASLLVVTHHVPGHWCLLLVDFTRRQFVYYDPLMDSPFAASARSHVGDHLKTVLERQVTNAFDVDSFGLKTVNWPKQPDGISCGVCVNAMIEILSTKGIDALYTFIDDREQTLWTAEELLAVRARQAVMIRTPDGAAGDSYDAELEVLADPQHDHVV